MKNKAEKTASFGFQDIPEQEKVGRVQGIFSHVAGQYDLMNDIMSGGLHRIWKQRMIRALPLRQDMQVLDMAGGTGDIAFGILKQAEKQGISIGITISDLNPEMLEQGRARAIDRNLALEHLHWQQANAETLPFPDRQFDAYTIAFGIRNVTHIDQALKEAYRVLRPGGFFACLEFSHVENPALAKLYDWYSFAVIPPVGGLIAGNQEAYAYLVESIRRFPQREVFSGMLQEAGFQRVNATPMTGGVVALHTGWKI